MAIHQEVTIPGSPRAVYDVLMSSDKFTKMTGGREAKISSEVGGVASMFGGDIQARNIELVPGKRVVQSWRSKNWPEGVHSIVTFSLSDAGGGKTKLVFDQAGYPESDAAMLEGGWPEMYWKPIGKIIEG